jgi:sRNA-binding protein
MIKKEALRHGDKIKYRAFNEKTERGIVISVKKARVCVALHSGKVVYVTPARLQRDEIETPSLFQ